MNQSNGKTLFPGLELQSSVKNLTNQTVLSHHNSRANELFTDKSKVQLTDEPQTASLNTRIIMSPNEIISLKKVHSIEEVHLSVNQTVTFSSNLDCEYTSTQLPASNNRVKHGHEQQSHFNSRLLVLILLLGLFGVVILTLLSVFVIKFCFCAHRKHVMQHNLVNDLNLQCTCTYLNDYQTNMRSAGNVLPGELPLCLLLEHNRALLESSGEDWTHVDGTSEQRALFTDYAMLSGGGTATRQKQYMTRPPSYSELFGSQSTNLSLPPTLDVAPSTSTGFIAEPPATAHLNHHNSLLIKLNLNKTKVVSPENLITLSKLLDVPIVMQKEYPEE